MAEICKLCITLKEEILANGGGGDGSEVICNHTDESKTIPIGLKRQKQQQQQQQQSESKKKFKLFPSVAEFDEKIKTGKPTKWSDLSRDKIFRVLHIDEVVFQESDGSERVSKFAEMEDATGEGVKVWLPGIVAKELSRIDVENIDTYIRPLGQKTSAKTNRTYHNFEILKDN